MTNTTLPLLDERQLRARDRVGLWSFLALLAGILVDVALNSATGSWGSTSVQLLTLLWFGLSVHVGLTVWAGAVYRSAEHRRRMLVFESVMAVVFLGAGIASALGGSLHLWAHGQATPQFGLVGFLVFYLVLVLTTLARERRDKALADD